MEKNTEKKLNILKNINMSEIEKMEIRDSLKHFMVSHPIYQEKKSIFSFLKQSEFIVSPYNGISMKYIKTLTFSFVGILIMGGTITFTSGNSLPGDMLYPVKINVKEKIEETMATKPEEKLAMKEKKVTRRLEEIKTLQKKKDLTKKEAVIAQATLTEHVKELNDTINQLQSEGKDDVVIASTAELLPKTEEIMKETEENMDTLKVEESEENKDVVVEEKKVSNKKEQIEEEKAPVDLNELANSQLIKKSLNIEVQKQIDEIKKTVEKIATDKINETVVDIKKNDGSKDTIEEKEIIDEINKIENTQ
jgi:hypothetical protein